jgi:hypothetical protein
MKKLVFILLLAVCSCEDEKEMIINPYIYDADFVPVILSWGQSNEIGRAEFDRYLELTPYPFDPTVQRVYVKTDYTSTDNGDFTALQVGSPHTREYDLTSFRTYGAYVTAAIKLEAILNKPVYIIPTADGGTIMNNGGAYRSWHPSITNECFDVAMDNYYQVAIDKIQLASPGKLIKVFIVVTEGETDAIQGRTQAEFYNDIVSVVSAMRAYEYLQFAPLIVCKINYMQTAAEDVINAAWQQYADANPDLVRIVTTSDLTRKVDLTTTQKGGISPTAADDEHLSYLAQNTKGLRVAEAIRAFYGWADVSIIPSATNTAFNPASIGTVHVRLQCTSGKTTLVANQYNVSSLTNDGSVGSFSVIAGKYQYKEDSQKGWVNSSFSIVGVTNVSRIQSSAAIGTTLFNHSFSFAAWVRPRDGNPPSIYTLYHDVQNTGSVNNSRTYAIITTDGKINAVYAQGGTVVQATTASAIFTNGTQDYAKHIAITFTSGNFIRIYVDGVLQTLDAGTTGNLSTVTMASYVNGTNVLTIGANRTGASTYNNHFYGHIREFMIQPVVYSTTDIANLMLN